MFPQLTVAENLRLGATRRSGFELEMRSQKSCRSGRPAMKIPLKDVLLNGRRARLDVAKHQENANEPLGI